jgi:ADP-dependent NAD(P)H-hydrate dehydratase / NAD(P)H-hydrate epimerase
MSFALFTNELMNEADRLAVAVGTPGVLLMQRAGQAVAKEIERRFSPRPVCVLCGPGNNGGDGFVAATSLAQAGWPIRVALSGDIAGLRGDALHHARLWHGRVESLMPSVIDNSELVIDALFGSGLNRRLQADARDTLAYARRQHLPIVAVDIPSGVSGDTGENLGAAPAVCTVTFVRKKPGHLLLPGRDLCGEVVVADIGMPRAVLDTLAVDVWENAAQMWQSKLPKPHSTAYKYSRGHALLYGGYPMTGAARMAARAAARVGAGLTTIAVTAQAFPIYAPALTSIMAQPLRQDQDFDRLLEDPRYTALAIGPGAGINDSTRALTLSALRSRRPVVLDADALTAFAGRTAELFAEIRGACVMTPHDGEFKRIFDDSGDKLTRVRRAARESGAVIVLKGADTVIAAPDGRAIINSNAPATLATAGSGDVLGGIILGLLAQGMDAFPAAAAGVWMHGDAASAFGPGLIAEDLPDLLPQVLRRLDNAP